MLPPSFSDCLEIWEPSTSWNPQRLKYTYTGIALHFYVKCGLLYAYRGQQIPPLLWNLKVLSMFSRARRSSLFGAIWVKSTRFSFVVQPRHRILSIPTICWSLQCAKHVAAPNDSISYLKCEWTCQVLHTSGSYL